MSLSLSLSLSLYNCVYMCVCMCVCVCFMYSAISLRPTWGKAFMRKGKALEGLYRYPEAAAAFKQGAEVSTSKSIDYIRVELTSTLV